jgi:S1-C subfamily serine protease
MQSRKTVNGTVKNTVSAAVLFFLLAGEAFTQSVYRDPLVLRPGRSVESIVELDERNFGYRSFEVRVDRDVFALRVNLEDAPADLDLFIRYGDPIENYKETDASSSSWLYNESLFISRLSDIPLKTGVYHVDVVYQGDRAPVQGFRRLKEIPFRIAIETITSRETERIDAGMPVNGVLEPEEGMAKTFSVRLPEGTRECRVDLFNTTADLDLLINYEKAVPERYDADYIAETLIGNESVVLDGSEDEPELPAGDYFITVFDAAASEFSQSFGLQVSLQADPPRNLLAIPRFPRSDDELQQALYSTVEVTGELGRGTGCLVSDDGLVLTSWHVVQGFDGDPAEQVVISPSFSSMRPPRELFRARVLRYDKKLDLALLDIETGLYDQRIPYDYRFPSLPLAAPGELQIGQPLSVIGYPGGGEAGSRVSISLSRGFIGGFEELGGTVYFKTDGTVQEGSSGGAVVNAYFELLGIVAFKNSTQGDGFAYVFPVSEIPEDWLELIEGRNK